MGVADFTSKSDYVQFHKRITKIRGRADACPCVSCGGLARDWSLRLDGNPFDVNDYEPRCRSCHKKMDCVDPEFRRKMSESLRGNRNAVGNEGWRRRGA